MQNQKYVYPVKYYFDKIKLLHNTDSSVHITINGKESISKDGYSFVQLDSLTDSVEISIDNSDTSKYVEIYGIILDNEMSKIDYHTIGVNGATAQSYLKCDFYRNHLSDINPDLIIISLGTNEAYDDDFPTLNMSYEFKDLIYQIQDVSPNAAIKLTTPNDHLKNRKYKNDNIQQVRDNILRSAMSFN